MKMSAEKPTQETLEFQAEVKKILDIVIHSLYTEREIFVRELISNAADALEKFRHQRVTEAEVFDGHLPLEITIDVDPTAKTLTITDTGIGMSREELIENLGTIAHSGSKSFLLKLEEAAKKDVNLIGQFGVGFYSAFMAAESVRVLSRSFRPQSEGWEWSSDATTYTISPAPGIRRGTKIIISLRDDAKEFAEEATIKRIIKQYSSFVPFPIMMKGEKLNTVQAIWTRNRNEIKEEEYTEFYKFVANTVDEPSYRLHFSTDAPLAIRALLFAPKENFELFGLGRVTPGVSLYCQRVLIEQHSANILPEFLRFVKGVVDSDDLPLNISRQALQDSTLVNKIKKVITTRFLKFLDEQAKADPKQYGEFWRAFGIYLKEGATSDFTHRPEIAKLLRFESSKAEPGELVSLADYLGRMRDGQKEIYYINGPSRELIESGPYVEAFRARDLEILYTLEPIDDFVLSHLGEYEGKRLVSADRAELDLPEVEQQAAADAPKEQPLDKDVVTSLTGWMKETLGERVKEVRESKRLVGSPAMIVNPDGFMTSTMERIVRAANKDMEAWGSKTLEINSKHPLIKHLADLRIKDEAFARTAAEQIFDNALIQAGLLTDERRMVERLYAILDRAVRA